MNTIGLNGLLGLEQLDRSGLYSLKLVMLLVVFSGCFGVMLALLAGSVAPNSVFAPYYTDQVVMFAMVGLSGTIGLTLALNILLARTTDHHCFDYVEHLAGIYVPGR